MAIASRIPDNVNFLSPVGFKFTCDALPTVTYFCQSANIPGVSLSPVEISTPFNPHYVAGDRLDYEELNMRIMVDENMKNFIEVYDWVKEMSISENFEQYETRKKKGLNTQGVLTVLTGSNVPQIEVHFKNMFPISISGLQFDIGAADITYITADISFRYNSYSIKNLLNN